MMILDTVQVKIGDGEEKQENVKNVYYDVMIMSSTIGPQLKYQLIDHHPITNPAKWRCNSLNNKEIIEGYP